ncbi:4Fe-4S dicluster domain-containing protein [Candidatus Thorarchaeota archaeon]|nr:MAG: 4Fe-4S dicluster domain-containing protein [Candidatus Thorarchaeota archaeon]
MDKSRVLIGEKPVISMDVVDGKIRLTWKTSLLNRTLDYEISKCVGCSLCLPCPWDAITLGPVQETASGRIEGAPLVNVDPDICTFCGLCDSACIYGAFDAKYEGEGAVNEFTRIQGTHEIDEEKCAPCVLCSKVCPTDSLDVEVKVDHKKSLVTYKGLEQAEGTIKIDEDKCSYCGLCEILCPEAIKIFWSDDAKPPDFRPAVGIRVDEDHCDYCGLCQDICPDDAIKVECTESSAREIKQPTITGKLIHNDETCIKCGLCAIVCPYEALKVEKPFTGEVKIVKLEKCDPTGCNNCFNICPVDAIYPTGTKDKIAILDHCVYCGACEHSCPYDVLEVQRDSYLLKEIECDREWEQARKLFFDTVIGKDPPPSGLFERLISVKPVQRLQVKTSTQKGWESEDGERKSAMMSAQRVKDFLKKNPRLHLQFERGATDKVVEKIKNVQEAPPEE